MLASQACPAESFLALRGRECPSWIPGFARTASGRGHHDAHEYGKNQGHQCPRVFQYCPREEGQ
ncbi:hypothetical protein [Brachybacterium sacelli]|uniref:hypothetical protein n=1 Tax=Brachybacterium sacelli TaxID=173364 RepID=UPI003379AF5B